MCTFDDDMNSINRYEDQKGNCDVNDHLKQTFYGITLEKDFMNKENFSLKLKTDCIYFSEENSFRVYVDSNEFYSNNNHQDREFPHFKNPQTTEIPRFKNPNVKSKSTELYLKLDEDSKTSDVIFNVSHDLNLPSSKLLQDEDESLLNKEMINQTLYKIEEEEVLTKKEEQIKHLIHKVKLQIPPPHNRIKNSDLMKIRVYSIPLNKEDQLLRLCNDFNFFGDHIRFYPKKTLVKCEKSKNSFEADTIHMSYNFPVKDYKNIKKKPHTAKIIIEKLKKIPLLMLMYGKFFKDQLKELTSLTDKEMNEVLDDKIQLKCNKIRLKQEELFRRIELFCKQTNKIKI